MRLGFQRVCEYVNTKSMTREELENHYYVLEFVPSIHSKQIKRLLPLDRTSLPGVSSWWKGISSISYMSKRSTTFETKHDEITPRQFKIAGLNVQTSNIRDYVNLVSSISSASSYLHITAVRQLMRAATRSSLPDLKRVCNTLLKLNFPVRDASDEHGRSALLNAAISNREEAVRYFLGLKTSTQQQHTRQLVNAIQASARHNHKGVSSVLLQHGANPKDAVHIAARYASRSHLQLFIQNNETVVLTHLDKHGRSPASVASEFGRLESLKYLIQVGGTQEVSSSDGDDDATSSIFVVAPVPLSNTSKFLIQLLKERSSRCVVGKFNTPAPKLESVLQHVNHVIIYLDENTLCRPSCCLHILVALMNRKRQHQSVSVALKVEPIASSNAAQQIAMENINETSPDHAAKRQLFEFINTTQHTVVPFFKFSDKRQESEVAVRSLLQTVKRFAPSNKNISLIKKPPSYTQLVALPWPHANANAFVGAIKNNHRHTFDVLIQREINVNLRTPIGTTAVLSSARYERVDMMRELLRRGADYDAAETQTGWTCAHFAAYRGNDTIAQILVDCGASLEHAESKYGTSPLHIASREGHDEVARVRIMLPWPANMLFTSLLDALHNS